MQAVGLSFLALGVGASLCGWELVDAGWPASPYDGGGNWADSVQSQTTMMRDASYGETPTAGDEGATYRGGTEWFGLNPQASTQTESRDADSEEAFASYPLPPQGQARPVRPGGSLSTLAEMLLQADPQLRAALMRHFCHAIVCLKTPYVGVPELPSGNKMAGMPGEVTQMEVDALKAKLQGVIGAAEASFVMEKALGDPLLVPFARVMREGEDLLYGLARKGDAAMMVAALHDLAPMLMRGLSYLEGPRAQAASGVLDPIRVGLLKRASELDDALMEAQRNPRYVLDHYQMDMTDEALQKERTLAALKSGGQTVGALPPPDMTIGITPVPTKSPPTASKRFLTFMVWFFIVLIIYTLAKMVSVVTHREEFLSFLSRSDSLSSPAGPSWFERGAYEKHQQWFEQQRGGYRKVFSTKTSFEEFPIDPSAFTFGATLVHLDPDIHIQDPAFRSPLHTPPSPKTPPFPESFDWREPPPSYEEAMASDHDYN